MEEELKMVTQTMEYERLNNGWTLLFNLNKSQQPIKEAALQKPLADGHHADEFKQLLAKAFYAYILNAEGLLKAKKLNIKITIEKAE